MMNWLNGVRTKILVLVIAFITTSFLLFPLFPASQDQMFTRWLLPIASAQIDLGRAFKELLERTGLYTPPRRGTAPAGRRSGGAGRGPICTVDSKLSGQTSVKALISAQPIDSKTQEFKAKMQPEIAGGVTIVPQPTFWFYIPYIASDNTTSNHVAQFVLLDENSNPVLNELITIQLRDHAQLVEYSLPYTLQPETLYTWYFSVICDAEKLSRNPVVRGWVQRVEPDPDLEVALKQGNRYQPHRVYAEKGLWFETINSLVNTRRRFPDTNQEDWITLLTFLEIPQAEQPYLLEPAPLVEREVVNGNQLPASM